MKFIEFFKAVSPVQFEMPWHIKLIIKYLELVAQKKIKNLMILTAPQHGKSATIERFLAYYLSQYPLDHVVFTSYSDDLCNRASNNAKAIVNTDWFQQRFPYPLGKSAESRWQLNIPGQDGRYSFVASGINSALTGHTSNLGVLDDCLKSRQDALSPVIREGQWNNYTSSFESRLSKDGQQVAISTLWHQDDLMHRIIKRAEENPLASQWTVLILPATNDDGEDAFVYTTHDKKKQPIKPYKALWPSRFPRESLNQKRSDMGEAIWQSLYQCISTMGTDVLFPAEAWGVYDGINTDQLELIVQSWDTASKTTSANDPSACLTLGRTNDGRVLLLDFWKGKVDFRLLPGIVQTKWASARAKYGSNPLCIIEDASSGQQLLQILQDSMQGCLLAGKPGGKSKFVRAEAVTVWTRSGCVCVPRVSDWHQNFIASCQEFPLGRHDEEVDCLTQGLKSFASDGDFKVNGQLQLSVGKLSPEQHAEAMLEEMAENGELPWCGVISPELDDFDRSISGNETSDCLRQFFGRTDRPGGGQ